MKINSTPFGGAKWLWLNGHTIQWDAGTTNVSDHALHYGTGVFEGIRCYDTPEGPAVFRLDAHLNRLFASAEAYDMRIPFSKENLAAAVFGLIHQNYLENCYIRILCWFGTHDLGITSGKWPVQTAILAWPWRALFADQPAATGIRVAIAPWRKIHWSMLPTTAKASGQYLSSLLCTQYAKRRGYDEALLLDASGNLAEGAAENIFLIKDDKVLTNDENSSILLGITRDSIIDIARDLEIEVTVRALTMEDLFTADYAFFTGTAAEMVRVREVDGKQIGAPGEHPHAQNIRSYFQDITAGRSHRFSDWLTHIGEESILVPVARNQHVAMRAAG